MRIGVIDLGSNSIRLVVYYWDGSAITKIQDISHQAQSLLFIRDHHLSKAGIDHMVNHLKELMVMGRSFGIDELRIFATASLRGIDNALEAKAEIENQIQHPIDILQGHEESLIGFEGMRKVMTLPLEGLAIDIGGGSTEITHFKNDEPVHTVAIPIGSLSLYRDHVIDIIPNDFEQLAIRTAIRQALSEIPWLKALVVDSVIGIGGSARAVMTLHQARYDINASIFDMTLSSLMVHAYASLDKTKREALVNLMAQVIPDRFTTAIPGFLILDEVMQSVQAGVFRLSSYGVREGYLISRILNRK